MLCAMHLRLTSRLKLGLCDVRQMFGIASDLVVAAQRTQELAATNATACYKKADQHVSQVGCRRL